MNDLEKKKKKNQRNSLNAETKNFYSLIFDLIKILQRNLKSIKMFYKNKQ